MNILQTIIETLKMTSIQRYIDKSSREKNSKTERFCFKTRVSGIGTRGGTETRQKIRRIRLQIQKRNQKYKF